MRGNAGGIRVVEMLYGFSFPIEGIIILILFFAKMFSSKSVPRLAIGAN